MGSPTGGGDGFGSTSGGRPGCGNGGPGGGIGGSSGLLGGTGFSGGGAIAALIAARRHDVVSLRTVAGNLDVAYVNRIHGVSPMPASLNPIDEAARLSGVAQVHFSSAQDTVVPPEVAKRFAAAVGGRCVRTLVVNGVAHDGDWAARWPALLARTPACAVSP